MTIGWCNSAISIELDKGHRAISDMRVGEPAVTVSGAGPARIAQEKLIDVGLTRAFIDARNDSLGRRIDRPNLGHAELIGDLGEGLLRRRGRPVRDVGCRDRTAGWVGWNAHHAIVAQSDVDAPQRAPATGHLDADAVEDT